MDCPHVNDENSEIHGTRAHACVLVGDHGDRPHRCMCGHVWDHIKDAATSVGHAAETVVGVGVAAATGLGNTER